MEDGAEQSWEILVQLHRFRGVLVEDHGTEDTPHIILNYPVVEAFLGNKA